MQPITINIPSALTSWRSSLCGAGLLVVGIIQASNYSANWKMALHDPVVQLSVVAALLGYFAKDKGDEDSHIAQPSTPEALAGAGQAAAADLVKLVASPKA